MEKDNIIQKVLEEVKTVIKGKDQVVENVLIALLAKGHILIEDIPGVGKTRRLALMEHFGDIDKISKASEEELSKVVDKRTAKNIYQYFNEG